MGCNPIGDEACVIKTKMIAVVLIYKVLFYDTYGIQSNMHYAYFVCFLVNVTILGIQILQYARGLFYVKEWEASDSTKQCHYKGPQICNAVSWNRQEE